MSAPRERVSISVVYPAYDEEQNIVSTVERSVAALRAVTDDFEIIIVNDGSRDKTGELADDLARRYPQIRVIHQSRNMGQVVGIITGFMAATKDLLIHNGVDYPFDLADLKSMLPALSDADIVVGVRKSRPGYTVYRKLLSIATVRLIQLFFDVHLRDYSFVQLFRQKVWREIEVDGRSTGFFIPEALIRAHDLGYRLAQMDIEYHARAHGKATAGKPSVVAQSLADLLRFWTKRVRGKTPRSGIE
jgi:glycosyltransferase involved in cell wall biosynthesis